jgi:hypothetical protein
MERLSQRSTRVHKDRSPGQRQNMDCYTWCGTFLNWQSHGKVPTVLPAASSSTVAKLGKGLRIIGNLAQARPDQTSLDHQSSATLYPPQAQDCLLLQPPFAVMDRVKQSVRIAKQSIWTREWRRVVSSAVYWWWSSAG